MALPAFNSMGYLPGGEHEATWDQLSERFGTGRRRREILVGLDYVVERLQSHGVSLIWLDGSFVTSKQRPSDVDVVYRISPGGDKADWTDVGRSKRDSLKQNHRVDLWRHPSPQQMKNAVGAGASARSITIKEFFSSDAEGRAKGIVKLTLTKAGES